MSVQNTRRPSQPFNKDQHEAIGRILESQAEQNPDFLPALQAWREGNAMIDEWEREANLQELSSSDSPA